MTLVEAFARLRGVEDEVEAARFAVDGVAAARPDPTLLAGQPYPLRPHHFTTRAVNLDLTYVLRLFAEFEEFRRDYRAAVRPRAGRRSQGRTQLLLDRIATTRRSGPGVLADAHAVRTFPNAIVHDRGRTARLAVNESRSRLSTFLADLPRRR